MKNIRGFLVAFLALFVFAGCSTMAKVTAVAAAVGGVAGVIPSNSASAIIDSMQAVDSAAEKFTPEQEYYIGRAVAATIFANYKAYGDAKAQMYLNKICQALVVNSEKPELFKGYYVAILDSDEINALSSAGGHIMITRGLLECALSEDALAAVIAHEIAHIHLEHGMNAIKASRKTEAIKSLAGTALVVATDGSSSSVKLVELFDASIGDVISTMVNSGYSQKQEFAADDMALKLMADAGYDPLAMDEMLNVLNQKSTSKEKGFGKTHPSADKRIKNLKAEYAKYKVENTRQARVVRYESNKMGTVGQ